jgi:protein disulfide-isomerase A6
MLPKTSTTLLTVALLGTLPVNAAGLYTKNSPVLQIDANSYDRLVAQSNHTSVSNLLDT